jgi:DNA adenine methylase
MSGPQPFIKWVGSKRQIVEDLLQHVPESFNRYHEPMVGGGTLFWALVRAGRLGNVGPVLADTNRPLIDCYRAVRADPEKIIKRLRRLRGDYERNGEALFYKIRDKWNRGYNHPADFIFLKQTAFNGLWRCNRSGQINMPWGHYETPKILDADNLRACSQALQAVEFHVGNFVAMSHHMLPGDVVYFDPPYWGCFDLYNAEGFSRQDHVDLIKLCAQLQKSGIHVIYTNRSIKPVWNLIDKHWSQINTQVVRSRCCVNRDGQGRGPVEEIIASSWKRKN